MTKKKFDVKALRDKVLTSEDIKYGEVYVEEWDATLPIKTLSSGEMKEVTKHSTDQVRLMIVAVLNGCKTEDGEAVFTREDLAIFETQKSFNPIRKVAEAILEISGFSEEGLADAKNN